MYLVWIPSGNCRSWWYGFESWCSFWAPLAGNQYQFKRPNWRLPKGVGMKPILMELKSKKLESVLLFWCFQSFTASEDYTLSMTRSTCDDHYSVIAVEAKTKFFSPWVNSFGASPWNHLIGCKQRKKIAGFLCFCFSKLLKFSRLIFPVNFVLATPPHPPLSLTSPSFFESTIFWLIAVQFVVAMFWFGFG